MEVETLAVESCDTRAEQAGKELRCGNAVIADLLSAVYDMKNRQHEKKHRCVKISSFHI